jgi:phosphoribosylformimino-5-aminoimidazole carboxamide ribonucleotide (ProFAR) isomerase
VLVVPSIDLLNGRSRVVYWPGAAGGTGAPTDRPERIAERFVAMGARPHRVAGAVPLQVAGGLEGGDNIRLAFANGATRAVVSMALADDRDLLAECVAAAGDWLAVGLDVRPERIYAYPWRRPAPPTLVELAAEFVAAGVRRLVLSGGGASPDPGLLAGLARDVHAELFSAGGSVGVDTIKALRDAGIAGIILGEPLLTGAVDFAKAVEAAA